MEAKHVAFGTFFFFYLFHVINAWEAIPGKTCGVANSVDRIVGGSQVSSTTDYPWQARFTACYKTGVGVASDTGNTLSWHQRCMLCGASIISPFWLLTAAHCTAEDTKELDGTGIHTAVDPSISFVIVGRIKNNGF